MASTKLIESLRNGPGSSLIQPASRAFMLGYLLDVLPTLFKQVLRYVLVTLRTIARTRKRISQERAASKPSLGITSTDGTQIEIPSSSKTTLYADGIKPALQQLPLLLQSIVKALLTSLGPKGVAFTCALAMTSTMLMDSMISSILMRPTKNAFTSSAIRSSRRQAFSTFVSAAISSSFALYMIQKDAIGDHNALKAQYPFRIPFRKSQSNNRLLPTPLAPGGHFLARLTSLSVPATPGEKGSRSPVEKSFAKLPALSPQDERNPTSISRSPSSAQTDPSSDELGTASPTIDLSLFALVRAMDTFVRVVPLLLASQVNLKGTAVGPAAGMKLSTTRNHLNNAQRQARTSLPVHLIQSLGRFGKDQAEGLTFVVACAIIMYNWFYHPERLPPTYVKWISNLASMDHRLLEALRCIRNNKPHYLQYGDRKTEPAAIDLLGSLAESMGHPYGWGDITRLPHTRDEAKKMKKEAIKNGEESQYILHGAAGPRGRGELAGLPCELVHCGIGGSNCFKNALYRFLRAWKVCMGIYFPVHLVPRLIFGPGQFKREPVQALLKVLKGSMRSATFLSTYIASIWFMVCMARSMVLPRLLPNVSFRYWDSGLGPIIGSWTCGWSVFIEEKRKRAEMALYVAPRALFALAEMSKPGWLSKGQKSALQAERLLFGMSVGIVIAAAKHRPEVLRGLTALIGWVVAPANQAGPKRIRATAPRSA